MAAGSTYPPVGPVSFDVFCAVMAEVSLAQLQSGQLPTEHTEYRSIDPYADAAAARGIDAATWKRAQLVWGCRSMLDPSLAVEQGQAISKVMTPAMHDMSGVAGAISKFALDTFGGMMSPPKPARPDPNDPRLAPVDGVTIETYVRLIGTQILYPAITPEQLRVVAVDQLAMPADRWEAISAEWGNRVVAGPPVSLRYAELVCALLS